MNPNPFCRPILCALAACILSSCADAAWQEYLFPHNVRRQVAFDESAFTGSLRSGSGVVRGQVFLDMKDGTRFTPANSKVSMVPVTAYTTEMVQRKFVRGVYLAKPDPRYFKYVRVTQTDRNGNFIFRGLPPGHYYVGTKITFLADDSYDDADNNFQELYDNHSCRAYAEASVKAGQAVTITDWNVGPERVP